MEWKSEFERLREKLELMDCAGMESEDALKANETLGDEAYQSPIVYF